VSERIQAVRGMNDILPHQTTLWRHVEQIFCHAMAQYAYDEIRFPLVESTALFSRTIGEVTDIVEKEMYTFQDRNGDSLTLRPEGTAGCVRACIEHGLLHNQQQKLWYAGPVFRHEKPQKGRYRQFSQMGVEAFGYPGVAIELEMISICQRLWSQLNLSGAVHLQVNTLGQLSERQAYREKLTAYFKSHWDKLDEDSQRRLDKNPLRILDSKNHDMQTLIHQAPKLIDEISEASLSQFKAFCNGLDSLNIAYTINPTLVRGLDYYGGLVFEWVTEHLGSQATVCAGGRFDGLVEQFGGPATPAIGFALGVERLILLIETLNQLNPIQIPKLAFVMAMGEAALDRAILLGELLRNAYPDVSISVNTMGGGFKSQFKKADKSGARFALIIGEEELSNNKVSIKDLRMEGEQAMLSPAELLAYLEPYT
jgi:histidyl-tRNA synthetase